MKRVWLIGRLAVLVAASYYIFSHGWSVERARAEGGGSCDTALNCSEALNGGCRCSASTDCGGCFRRNNDPGCGKCSSGPDLLD